MTASTKAAGVRDEIIQRLERKQRVESSPDLMALTLEHCRHNPVTFINDWCWTFDPRNTTLGLPTSVPFTLRPRQTDFINWLQDREALQENGLVEKSRDEGMTWLVCAYMLHHWLFIPGFAGALGSRKQDLVDKIGDPKSIFWKLRFLLESLPGWFYPIAFDRRSHDNYLLLQNPETGASITGEGGDNMGRGGRSSLYFIDEWAFVERAEAVNAAVSQNSNIVIKGSTPNGVGNLFYVERFSGRFPVFTFNWRDNPDKNRFTVNAAGEKVYPWYERQKRNLDPLTLAQEVDISYTASAEGVLIPGDWVQAAIDFPLEEGAVRQSGVDVSGEGRDKTPYAHRRGGRVTRVIPLTGRVDQKADQADELAREDGVAALYYDRLGVGEGFTARLKRVEDQLPYRVVGVANSDAPSHRKFEDQPDVPAAERFANYAAELAWALRLRFRRTYERKHGIAEHPDDECISIPNDPTLIAQLSQPTYSKNSKDKIRVDKKGNGIASPDSYEAVMYAFAGERNTGTTDRAKRRLSGW